jgi:hypothetical protein
VDLAAAQVQDLALVLVKLLAEEIHPQAAMLPECFETNPMTMKKQLLVSPCYCPLAAWVR